MVNGGCIMMLDLLTKEQLQIINSKTLRYSLSEAEKDYFLAIVSKIIYESTISKKLVFKGGTAIHHCYLPQSRFSEDLDFTAQDNSITLKEIKKVLEAQDFLSVKREYVSKATIKLERVLYTGPLVQPNSLKVEIDFIQNIVLPPKELPYQNVWGIDTKVRVMDIREICAEKIRAMNDRIRYRDFFDFYLIMQQIKPDLKEVISLVRQKEVRKVIATENIIANWKIAKTEKQKEFGTVYYSQDVFGDDELIGKTLEELDFDPIPVNIKIY
jgi:predicted nucleotidyltransferase component of viral defense system